MTAKCKVEKRESDSDTRPSGTEWLGTAESYRFDVERVEKEIV